MLFFGPALGGTSVFTGFGLYPSTRHDSAFTVSGWLGLGLIAAVVLALAGYGVWEAKHPPEVG